MFLNRWTVQAHAPTQRPAHSQRGAPFCISAVRREEQRGEPAELVLALDVGAGLGQLDVQPGSAGMIRRRIRARSQWSGRGDADRPRAAVDRQARRKAWDEDAPW